MQVADLTCALAVAASSNQNLQYLHQQRTKKRSLRVGHLAILLACTLIGWLNGRTPQPSGHRSAQSSCPMQGIL